MNWILVLCICTTLSLSAKSSRRGSDGEFKIRALVERKSYLVPLKTRFILKCSSSKFVGEKDGFDKDDQFDDDRPELIVLNSFEQTKKLVNYLSENSESKIDLIGWNKTTLDRVHRKSTRSSDKSGKKEFENMYESMFLSGKGFFRPNEEVDLIGQGQTCLLFTGFGQKDEAIYSCLYKPRLAWSNLAGGWMSRLSSLIDSGNSNDPDSLAGGKELNDLNLNNNVPLTEKLLYLTCLLTWPFNRECHLVKQFKLTVDNEVGERHDYWNGLNSHERFRLKKLLKELVKHCHPISSALPSLNKEANQAGGLRKGEPQRGSQKKGSQKGAKGESDTGFINDFYRLLFDDLFVNGFVDLINGVFSGLFSGLFSDLFGGLFSGLFTNLFSGLFNAHFGGTFSELFRELLGELFVAPFRDANLFYLICVLLFVFLCFSLQDDSKPDRKPSSQINRSQSDGIDLHIDAQIDARIGEEESSEKDVSLSPLV